MANGKRQFDPVAASAVAALDASERSIRALQQDAPVPELPAQSQSFRGARNMLSQVANAAPLNVLARGNLPVPGQGKQGQSPFGALSQFLPGMQGQSGGVPSPQQFLPGMAGNGVGGGGSSSGGGSQPSTAVQPTDGRAAEDRRT